MSESALAKPSDAATPVRVIVLEWNLPMLIEVLVELAARNGWQPVYCVLFDTRTERPELR